MILGDKPSFNDGEWPSGVLVHTIAKKTAPSPPPGSDCRGDGERPSGMFEAPAALLPPGLPPLLRVHLPPAPPHQLQHQLPHILRCCECHFNTCSFIVEILNNNSFLFEKSTNNLFFSGHTLPHLHKKKSYVRNKVRVYTNRKQKF